MTALGELFALEISKLPKHAAMAACRMLETQRAKVTFHIELAPLKLECSIRGGEVNELLFAVDGGYEKFVTVDNDRVPN